MDGSEADRRGDAVVNRPGVGLPTSSAPGFSHRGIVDGDFDMALSTALKARTRDHTDLTFCLDREATKELLASIADDGRNDSYAGNQKSKKTKELESRVKAASVTIRIYSMTWADYNALVSSHPARNGKDEQFNSSTFFEAAARATAEEVTATGTVPITDDEWSAFIEGLTDGEYDRIAGAVVTLNRNLAETGIAPLR